jgi:hypothetical protein
MRVKTPNSLQQFQEVPMRLDGQRESSNVEDDRSGGSSPALAVVAPAWRAVALLAFCPY